MFIQSVMNQKNLRILLSQYNNDIQIYQKKSIFQIFGGGCGGSIEKNKNSTNNSIIKKNTSSQIVGDVTDKDTKEGVETDLWTQLQDRIETISENSEKIEDQNSKSLIMNSIQYIKIREGKIQKLIKQNSNSIFTVLKFIDSILSSLSIIIQIDSLPAFFLSQILSLFSRFTFSYYIINSSDSKIIPDEEKKKKMAQISTLIELLESQQVKLSPGIEFELLISQYSINQIPSDSKLGQQILGDLFTGLISSVIQQSPSPELIDAIIQGINYLIALYKQKKEKAIFQSIYLIQETKWNILNLQREEEFTDEYASVCLEKLYFDLVQKTDSWEIKYEWVKTIKDLVIAKPMIRFEIFKEKIKIKQLKLNELKLTEKNIWEQLNEYKQIKTINDYEAEITLSKDNQIPYYLTFEELLQMFWPKRDEFLNFSNKIFLNQSDEQKYVMEKNGKPSLPSMIEYVENRIQNLLREDSNQNWSIDNEEILFFIKKIDYSKLYETGKVYDFLKLSIFNKIKTIQTSIQNKTQTQENQQQFKQLTEQFEELQSLNLQIQEVIKLLINDINYLLQNFTTLQEFINFCSLNNETIILINTEVEDYLEKQKYFFFQKIILNQGYLLLQQINNYELDQSTNVDCQEILEQIVFLRESISLIYQITSDKFNNTLLEIRNLLIDISNNEQIKKLKEHLKLKLHAFKEISIEKYKFVQNNYFSEIHSLIKQQISTLKMIFNHLIQYDSKVIEEQSLLTANISQIQLDIFQQSEQMMIKLNFPILKLFKWSIKDYFEFINGQFKLFLSNLKFNSIGKQLQLEQKEILEEKFQYYLYSETDFEKKQINFYDFVINTFLGQHVLIDIKTIMDYENIFLEIQNKTFETFVISVKDEINQVQNGVNNNELNKLNQFLKTLTYSFDIQISVTSSKENFLSKKIENLKEVIQKFKYFVEQVRAENNQNSGGFYSQLIQSTQEIYDYIIKQIKIEELMKYKLEIEKKILQITEKKGDDFQSQLMKLEPFNQLMSTISETLKYTEKILSQTEHLQEFIKKTKNKEQKSSCYEINENLKKVGELINLIKEYNQDNLINLIQKDVLAHKKEQPKIAESEILQSGKIKREYENLQLIILISYFDLIKEECNNQKINLNNKNIRIENYQPRQQSQIGFNIQTEKVDDANQGTQVKKKQEQVEKFELSDNFRQTSNLFDCIQMFIQFFEQITGFTNFFQNQYQNINAILQVIDKFQQIKNIKFKFFPQILDQLDDLFEKNTEFKNGKIKQLDGLQKIMELCQNKLKEKKSQVKQDSQIQELSAQYLKEISIMKKQLSQLMVKKGIETVEFISTIQAKQQEKEEGQFQKFIKIGKKKITQIINNKDWKIRFIITLSLITIREETNSVEIKEECAKQLVRLKAQETNDQVKEIFQNEDLVKSINSALKSQWKTQEDKIKQELDEKIGFLKQLQKQIQDSEDKLEKEFLIKQTEQLNFEINQVLENITGIGTQMGVAIHFLKDIKNDLNAIELKIDDLKKNINDVQVDLKYLRGKTVTQLLDIRRQKVEEEKRKIEITSIYVNLKTIEKFINGNKSKYITDLLTEQDEIKDEHGEEGEINEFLKQKKSCLLIHGQAGSGKSTLARKIEEFVWNRYKLNKESSKSDTSDVLVPIFVQLPKLKSPKELAIEETLKSDTLRFDDRQIIEFKEMIEQGKIKLLIIMDSYDELASNLIGINLYASNNLKKWASKEDLYYPKVIFTTRTEVLMGQYNEWFKPNDLKLYKEIEIQLFNKNQQSEFLEKYSILNIKKELLKIYQLIKFQKANESTILDKFNDIWKQIEGNPRFMKERKNDDLVSPQDLEIIKKELNKDKEIILSLEQERDLQQSLSELWTDQRFKQSIDSTNLQDLLETPFMMEIIVQVLPLIIRKRSDPKEFRKHFIKNFLFYAKEQIQEEILKRYFWETMRTDYNIKIDQEEEKVEIPQEIQQSEKIEKEKILQQIEEDNQESKDEKKIDFADLMNTSQIHNLKEIETQIYNLLDQVKKNNFLQNIDLDQFVKNEIKLNKPYIILKAEQIFKSLLESGFFVSFEIDKKIDFANYQKKMNDYSVINVDEIKLIEKSLITHNLNRFYFYDEFIQYYFETQIKKWQENGESEINYSTIRKDLWQFSTKLALEMIRYQLTNVTFEEEGQLFKRQKQSWQDQFFNDNENGNLKKRIRSGIPIKQKNNNFSFNHKSLQEFLVARSLIEFYKNNYPSFYINELLWVYTQLNKDQSSTTEKGELSEDKITNIVKQQLKVFYGNKNQKEANKKDPENQKQVFRTELKHKISSIIGIKLLFSNDQNNELLNEEITQKIKEKLEAQNNFLKLLSYELINQEIIFKDFHYGTLKFISGYAKNEKDFQQFLISLVKLSKLKEFIIAGSNAMNMLAYSKIYLGEQNFEGIHLKDSYLKSLNFYKSNFQNAIFENCDLSNTNLNKVDLRNATMKNVSVLETQILEGHTGPINSICFSKDGKMIVSGSSDGNIIIWNPETGQKIKQIEQMHIGTIWSVSFSPDQKKLVSCGNDKTIRLWEVQTGKFLDPAFLKHTAIILTVVFSPDGKQIVSGSYDNNIIFWNVENRDILLQIPIKDSYILSIAFSPDGKKIASGSNDKIIRIWDAEKGTRIGDEILGHQGSVWSVQFSSDGKKLVSGSSDQTIRIWHVETGKQVLEEMVGHTGQVLSVAFSQDGKKIVSGSRDKSIRIWNTDTGKQSGEELTGHNGFVLSVQFSPDGKKIVSGSSDNTIRTWNAEVGKQIGEDLNGHIAPILSVAFSPDGKCIASGGEDKKLKIWNSENGKQIQEFSGHGGPISSIVYTKDGKKIVTGCHDKLIRIWDLQTNKVSKELAAHNGKVYCLAISFDGKRIVSGSSDKMIIIWNLEEGKQMGEDLTGHYGPILCLAISMDGKKIVSGSSDLTIRIWDTEKWQQIEEISNIQSSILSVAFSPDGRYVISGNADGVNKNLQIWSIGSIEQTENNDESKNSQMNQQQKQEEEQKEKQQVQIQESLKQQKQDDDKKNSVQKKDIEKKKLINSFIGNEGFIQSLAFSRDGKYFFTGGSDKKIKIWNLQNCLKDQNNQNPKENYIAELVGHNANVNCIAVSPDGKKIVSGSSDNTIRIWVKENVEKDIKELIGNQEMNIMSFAQISDNLIVTGGQDKIVRIWNIEKQKQDVKELIGHNGSILCIAYNEKNRKIATGSNDNKILVWDLNSFEQAEKQFSSNNTNCAVLSLAFSQKGDLLVSGWSDLTIRVWDIDKSQQIGEELSGFEYPAINVAFSIDGQKILAKFEDLKIMILDYSYETKKKDLEEKEKKKNQKKLKFSDIINQIKYMNNQIEITKHIIMKDPNQFGF